MPCGTSSLEEVVSQVLPLVQLCCQGHKAGQYYNLFDDKYSLVYLLGLQKWLHVIQKLCFSITKWNHDGNFVTRLKFVGSVNSAEFQYSRRRISSPLQTNNVRNTNSNFHFSNLKFNEIQYRIFKPILKILYNGAFESLYRPIL